MAADVSEDKMNPGICFWSHSYGKEMMLVTDGPYKDWICYRHPDGHWVTLRQATDRDREELADAAKDVLTRHE